MGYKIFNIFISFIIIICAYASIYSESTDYEYTNSLAEIINEVEAIEGDIHIINEITSIEDTTSPSEILDAVNQAEESGTSDSTSVEFSNFNIVDSYNYMKSINSETAGWLNIPNMGSYPVMFSGDNSYYLTHSATKQEFENGAIFMNASFGGTFDDISLIHGHHLKSGGMFGSLKKYKDEWYFNSNDLIEVFDGTELRYYRPFSVFYYTDGEEYFPISFTSLTEKTEYISSLLDRSMVASNKSYTINSEHDLMILSTCDYEFEDCRLAVACYEVLSVPYEED